MATNNTFYSINVTDTQGVTVRINNWFDEYGTVFSVDRACHIDLNVSSKGEPDLVYGGTSNYTASTKILSLSIGGSRQVNIHWKLGGYNKLAMPLLWYHSGEGYKTAYGFGLPNMSWVTFQAYVYCEHGRSDVQNVTLELPDGSQLYFDRSIVLSSNRLSLKANPNGYLKFNAPGQEIFDSYTQTLRLSWKVWFWNHDSLRTLENTTLTIGSATDGNIVIENYATYFFYPFEAIYSPIDDWFMIGLGLGGLGLMVGSPAWAIHTLKKKGFDGIDHAGLCGVLALIGIGMVIMWLW